MDTMTMPWNRAAIDQETMLLFLKTIIEQRGSVNADDWRVAIDLASKR